MFGKWAQKLIKLRRNSNARANTAAALRFDNKANNVATQHYSARVHTQYRQAIFGDASGEITGVPEKLIGQAIAQQVRDSEQRRSAVPRLPTIIPLLLRQLRDPNASARDYVAVIKQDPVVAAAVLKIANSAYFNPYRKNVENFEHAVANLGIDGLRLVLSTAVMQPIVRGQNSKLPQQIWDHSLACAVCCQQLAEHAHSDGFKAYLLGLVHDVGAVTLFNQLQAQSAAHLNSSAPSAALLAQLIEQWSQPLSYWIAQDWQLPAEIVRALASQHETPAEDEPLLSQILRRGNCIGEAYLLVRSELMEREELQQIMAALQCPDNLLRHLDDAFTEAVAQGRS